MDDEILKTVESMLGKDIKVVDCEKTSSVREEEVLLINGIPVQIEGEDGLAIKSALMTGQVPPCDLLNQLLYRAGILRQPVHLETSLSVKSSVIRKEEVTVARHGKILNERRSETQENNIYTSSCKEVWEPINKLGALKTIIPIPVDRCLLDDGNAGNVFMLATPPDSSRIGTHALESQRKDSISMVPSTTASSASASFYRAAPIHQPTAADTGGTPATKSYSYTDCRRRSPAGDSVDASCPVVASRIGRPGAKHSALGKSSDSGKKLLNCMSFDSGHDDFFNSLSQSNFLSAVTGTCGSCSGFGDETHGSGTPTLHSNSISSCYDFISSSDEADHQTVHRGSITGAADSALPGYSVTSSKMPTIFGTVASDQCPKDSVNRKGFPQTTSCIKSSSSIDKTQQHATGAQPAQSQHALSSHSPQSNVLRSQLHDQPHHYLHHHHHHHHRHHLHSHHQQQHSHHHHHHQHATVGGSHKPLDNEENALVYRDGNLISGPLDTLIQHMVPTSDYYPDRSYLFAFLLSARLFIRPHELLAKICHLCNEQQDLNCTSDCRCSCSAMLDQSASGSGVDQVDQVSRKPLNNQLPPPVDLQKYRCCEAGASVGTPDTKPCPAYCDDQQPSECCRKLRQFAQHFVRLLAEWIDTFPYDFRDERLMQHVRAMTRKCIGIDSSLRKDVQTMLQELLQRLTVLERYEEFLLSLSQNYGTDGPNNATSTTTSSADSDGGSSVKNNANAAAAAMGLTKPASSILTIQNNLHSVGGSPAGGDGLIQSATIGVGQPLLTTSSSTSSAASGSGGSGGASNAYAVDISQLCPSPFLLAHQLTHIELERLSYIGPEEFVQAFAKENPHLEQSFSDMKKTRNLESYVQWFNRLSYLVATEIVKHPKKKQRVRIVEYWIETARECFNIGNFNSLMAIIAGLNMSPISRLKKTWSKVQCAKFLVLEHQMDPSSNFNSYRSTLKAAMWRSEGATDERERIVIPFFSLLVKDLYFLNEGCSNKLVNGHINFEKFWQLAKQVTEFIAWKQVSCPFEKLPKVIMFLQSSCVLNENRLAIASFECEPPENNHEKERYKSLKYEQHNSQHGQHQQQHQ